VFQDMMIHNVDMANFLKGASPVTVSAAGSSLVDPAIGAAGDVDNADVTLANADGRLAVIKNSRHAASGEVTFDPPPRC
jgi:myo-inositol 2-dehydrogenase/D-chiro-inositol 1-dehydrogenase